jgi:hypothetical protein
MDQIIKHEECNTLTLEDDSQRKQPSQQLPLLVACGHNRILIPKTGNTFPAFCVCVWHCISASSACTTTPTLVWRSKRDFLCLARSIATSAASVATRMQLPKAAFNHLTEEHVVPWIRPVKDITNDASKITSFESLRYLLESFQESQKSFPNHYHVRMKKSLRQLDTFLQSVAQNVDDNSYTTEATNTTLTSAWHHFCHRSQDTEGLTEIPHLHEDRVTTQMQSSRWGQYFASRENSQRVADVVLQYVLRKWKTNQHVLFVEPSCGHGDIVVALVERLKQHQSLTSANVTIVGYDIDPQAIATCQRRIALQSCGYDIHWRHQDFLESTRQNDAIQHRPTTIQFDDLFENIVTVCLGGPPYSTGAGNSHNINRDLPMLFVQHCQDCWQADCIAFLLPERYREINLNNEHPHWECETLELQSSTFYFQGKKKVTQPSILKTFLRTEKAEEAHVGSNSDKSTLRG